MFEWYVAPKDGYQKDTCLNEIEQCAQKLTAILGSIVNIFGGVYDHLLTTRIFTLLIIINICMSSKHYEENGYGLDLDLLTIL